MGCATIDILVYDNGQLTFEDGVQLVGSRGGDGGNGGNGFNSAGGGAGGNPGPSVCIILGSTAIMKGTSTNYLGQYGNPGKKGVSPDYNPNAKCYGGEGEDGLAKGTVLDSLRLSR